MLEVLNMIYFEIRRSNVCEDESIWGITDLLEEILDAKVYLP